MSSNHMELHFARVALEDAAVTGECQIFFSPSVVELEVVRRHILYLAELQGLLLMDAQPKSPGGAPLEGHPLILPGNGKIVFLQPGCRTSAGLCGNFYGINCFDGANLAELSDLVLSWTALKKHHAVFFSVPSFMTQDEFE